jgi:hypothetical protein
VPGAVGDTLHCTTREGEALPVAEATRRDSLGVVFRNWHPGPLLFQTVGDALAQRHLLALLRATRMLRHESADAAAARWPRTPTAHHALPRPVLCNAAWCDSAAPPGCANFADPMFGAPQASVDAARTGDGWARGEVFSERENAPRDERGMKGCLHLDVCSGWSVGNHGHGAPHAQAAAVSEWLTFTLPPMEVGLVVLCCAPFPNQGLDSKDCGSLLLEHVNASFRLGDTPVARPEQIFGKCVALQRASASGKSHPTRASVRWVAGPGTDRLAITHVLAR